MSCAYFENYLEEMLQMSDWHITSLLFSKETAHFVMPPCILVTCPTALRVTFLKQWNIFQACIEVGKRM